MKRYKKFYNAGKLPDGIIRNIPVDIRIGDLLADTESQIRRVGEEAGLAVMSMIMESERERILQSGAGYRHGSQSGTVYLGGRKVNTENLRARTRDGGKEIPLKAYQKFQNPDGLSGRIFRDMIRGISVRDYEEGVDSVIRGYGIRKSSVSRQFIRASEEKLRELMERRIDVLDPAVIFIDGKRFAENLIIAAIGVDKTGTKHVLGIWQGATENSAVCAGLIADMVKRGLDTGRKYLFVTDGAKAIRKAITDVFGAEVPYQRCHEHKKRNVTDHLPKNLQAEYRRKISAAYSMHEYGPARSALESCMRELERINPSAARSLEEGLEDTLTLHRLGLPEALRKSLRTTNCIESAFSQTETMTARVKRWMQGSQVQRWAASALLRAESRWQKIGGHRQMGILLEAVGREKLDKENKESYNEVLASSFN